MDNILELIEYATKAPSGHNTQPWKFSVTDNIIKILPDFTRRLAVVDSDDHELFISIGCALENLLIAAEHFGYQTEVNYFPADELDGCIVVKLMPVTTQKKANLLFSAISKRQVNRARYNQQPIPQEDLEVLRQAAVQEGVQWKLFNHPEEIQSLFPLVEEATKIQYSNKLFVEELINWLRFTNAEVNQYKDGLSMQLLGHAFTPRWLAKIVLKYFTAPKKIAQDFIKDIRSSSALMLFIAEQNDRKHWINIGRSFERVSLAAVELEINLAHMNMPCEIFAVRDKMRSELGLGNAYPMLLTRIGYAKKTMGFSLRRPLQNVLTR